jgi:hypothetical protein
MFVAIGEVMKTHPMILTKKAFKSFAETLLFCRIHCALQPCDDSMKEKQR